MPFVFTAIGSMASIGGVASAGITPAAYESSCSVWRPEGSDRYIIGIYVPIGVASILAQLTTG